MVEQKPLVLITGVSGFLGSQVCYKFLNHGGYRVRGTVRDPTNPAKTQALKEGFGEEKFAQLELVAADLLDEASIIEACKDCTYIVHVASPVITEKPKHEDDVIKPAVSGTMAVMRGAKRFGVKRVVMTSSVATVGAQPKDTKIYMHDETHWSDLNECSAYQKSKTLAEKSAWEFVENLPAEEKFEFVTILPTFILGPAFTKGGKFLSASSIIKIMTHELKSMPKTYFGICDVRECAEAHLRAVTVPEAAGNRFIISHHELWFKQIAEILHREFGKDYTIATKEMKEWVIKVGSWFSSEAAFVRDYWGKEKKYSNRKSIDILGMRYRPVEETIIDFANYLIDNEYIPDKRSRK